MSNATSKPSSDQDFGGAIKAAYNDVDKTISTNGFLVGKVGHKVALAISTTTIANDTETYTFSDSGTTLYVLTIIYTDSNRTTLVSAERTA